MYPRVQLFIFLFLIGIASLSGQSSFEPIGGEAALDTARGINRLSLLIRLTHKYNRTNPEKAIGFVEEAFDYQKEHYKNDPEMFRKKRLALLGFSADSYFYANQKEKALENLDKAFVLADSVCLPDKPCHERAMLYAFLGNYNIRTENFEGALEAHKTALPMFVEVDDIMNTANQFTNVGTCFNYMEQIDSALYYYNLSVIWHQKFDAPKATLGRVKYHVATAQTKLGNTELSNQQFFELIDFAYQNDLEMLSEVQIDFAVIKKDHQEYKASWELLKDCREKIFESQNVHRISQWYKTAAKATKELNIADSSMVFAERYIVLEDSLSKVENDAKISKLEESVNVKSKEIEIDSLSHRLKDQKKNLFFLLSLLMGALGVAFYFFRKSKQVREQSTLEIRYFLSGKSEINSEIEIDPFLENVLQIINENLEDTSFNVEALAAKAFTSRSNLFKKTKPLTGKSPVVLIREMRMEKAKLLLETNQFSVKEIAEKVGFEDSSYFGKVYKKYFGVSPSGR